MKETLSDEREELSILLRELDVKQTLCDLILERVIDADRDFIKKLKGLFELEPFASKIHKEIDKLAGPKLIEGEGK